MTTQQAIIKEQIRFYSDRYRKTDFIAIDTERQLMFQNLSHRAFLDGIDIPQLPEEQKTSTEGALTEEGITRALKRMKNTSSPG